jgi:hypothetical protein
MQTDNTYIKDKFIVLFLKILANNWIGKIAIKIVLNKIHAYPKNEIKVMIDYCKNHK